MAEQVYERLFAPRTQGGRAAGQNPCYEDVVRCGWALWQQGESREAIIILMQALILRVSEAPLALYLELLAREGKVEKASQFCDWLELSSQKEMESCLALLRLYRGDYTRYQGDLPQRPAYVDFAARAADQARALGLAPPPDSLLPLTDACVRLFLSRSTPSQNCGLEQTLRRIERAARTDAPGSEWEELCAAARRQHPTALLHALYHGGASARREEEGLPMINHLAEESGRCGLRQYQAAASGLASLAAARRGNTGVADSLREQCLLYFKEQPIPPPKALTALLPGERAPEIFPDKRLRIGCYGGFVVLAAGERVRFRTRRALELMAYFVHHAGRMIPRDELLLEFWPDRPPQKAGMLLHTTLYNLRRGLQGVGCESCIRHEDHSYGVDMSQVDCDHQEFGGYLAAAKEMSPVELLADTRPLSLYTGQYMNNIDGGWYLSTQIRVEQQVTDIRRRLGEYLMERGAYQEALHHLDAASQIDPLNESFHEQIIRCYVTLDNRAAAVRQYRLMCRQLREELSVDPQEAVQRRIAQLLGVDAAQEVI